MHRSSSPGKRLEERSNWELRMWFVGFPALGATIIGVVVRMAYDQASALTPDHWFWTAFTVLLGLFVVLIPPAIVWRELKRRQLEAEDAAESAERWENGDALPGNRISRDT